MSLSYCNYINSTVHKTSFVVTQLCFILTLPVALGGGSSLTNEKDHHYFLNRFVCVGEFFDG